MKKTIKSSLLFTTLLLVVFATKAQAQSTTTNQPRYKDVVVENPDPEDDMLCVML